MSEYKKILIAYENESQKHAGSYYLSIKNVSEEPVVIAPGENLYLNKTPRDVREQYPKVPHFSKSIKTEDEAGKPEF